MKADSPQVARVPARQALERDQRAHVLERLTVSRPPHRPVVAYDPYGAMVHRDVHQWFDPVRDLNFAPRPLCSTPPDGPMIRHDPQSVVERHGQAGDTTGTWLLA